MRLKLTPVAFSIAFSIAGARAVHRQFTNSFRAVWFKQEPRPTEDSFCAKPF
jgi:hypothetical protein